MASMGPLLENGTMAVDFDPGYVKRPFRDLVRDYPGADAFPPDQFRTEWGPIFHRGRLDGSARVLVIGQDPAAHEAIARRILVGEAGQRVQGALAKLGITKSYVMINAFLYSVIGSGAKPSNVKKKAIADYRNAWLDGLLLGTKVEAVITFGGLAKQSFALWQAQHPERGLLVASVTHPTFPESSGEPDAMAKLLADWNTHLGALSTKLQFRDVPAAWVDYGTSLVDGDLAPIPAMDMPAGLPAWMRAIDAWANRQEIDGAPKRASIAVTVPKGARPF